MGKASELDDFLERQPPLTPEEAEAREGPRPELQLDASVADKALDSHATVTDATERLAGGVKVVALRSRDSEVAAVAIPVEQYLELVTAHIRDRHLAEVKLDAQVAPSDATLSELGVAQANPRATWLHVEGYDPHGPASQP